jgi:uncharacterized protein (TIGR02271 family)
MITTYDAQQLLTGKAAVLGPDGSRIGPIGQVFLDDATGEPEWVTVRTGLFGGAESFVPLRGATVADGAVHVAFDKDTVKGAPRVEDPEGHLEAEDETALYAYYGLPGDGQETPRTGTGTGTDDAMTRSEERLDVSKERVATGRARLRKFVVTEQVTRTVSLRHDEVRIEREPVTDADREVVLAAGAALTPAEHEVVLTAERVVVAKEVVPVERVRLDVDTVQEDRVVSEEVRKEQIEVEGDVSTRGPADPTVDHEGRGPTDQR